MNEQILSAFSDVFYIKKLNIDLKKSIKNFSKIKFHSINTKEDDENIENLSESSNTYSVLDYDKKLKKIILNEFNYFKDTYLKYTNTNFKISTSWLTNSKPNTFSRMHNHKNCFYSGIFYLKVPKNSGNIYFEDYNKKSNFDFIPETYNQYNSNSYTFEIEENLLIFFPSYIFHKIKKNKSNENRISLAFNFFPIGKYGTADSSII
jgi:uncharacterized protein (TIGR02466 family)